MAEADVLPPDARVELIDGKACDLAPIGTRVLSRGESVAPEAFPDPLIRGHRSGRLA